MPGQKKLSNSGTRRDGRNRRGGKKNHDNDRQCERPGLRGAQGMWRTGRPCVPPQSCNSGERNPGMAWGTARKGGHSENQGPFRPCAGLWLLAGDFSMEPHQFFGFVTPRRLPDVFDCSTPCQVPAMLLFPLCVTSIAELGDRGRPRLKQPASPCLGEVETYPTWPCDQDAMDTESAAPADRGPCTQARGTEWIKGGRLV